MLKASFLRYLNFCTDFVGHIGKLRLISKLMTSTTRKQVITLDIFGALRDFVAFVQFKKRKKTPMEEC